MKKIFWSLIGLVGSLQAAETQLHTNQSWILEYLDTIPNFPKEGIQFKCIGKLLRTPEAFKKVIKLLANRYEDQMIDAIVGLDSRGFIFGSALSYELNLPFVMVRKAGKLPGDVISTSYALEYGAATFEMQKSSLKKGQRVIIIDDLLATGGTINAAGKLIEELGAEIVEAACLVELVDLKGRGRIPYPVFSLLQIEGD